MRRRGDECPPDLEAMVPEGFDGDGPAAQGATPRWPAALLIAAATIAGVVTVGGIARHGTQPAPAPLCPALRAMLSSRSAEGGPFIDQLLTDRRAATAALRAHRAEIAQRYPAMVSVRVGPGWGRGWSDVGGTAELVPVHDYALVVQLRSAGDCPATDEAFSSIAGVLVFFAH